MRVVRRLYFYTVAFISLQVILWGVITLVSSSIDAPVAGGLANLLARGLSQVLVGLPFFMIHWRVIQHDLAEDAQEQQTLIRAIFNYGLKIATLVPILTNLHAIIRRPLLHWIHAIAPAQNFLASTSFTENGFTIFLNLIVFIFATRLLASDWQSFPDSTHLRGVRRIYRYVWQLIAIISLVVGIQELLFSIFFVSQGIGNPNSLKLVSGFSVTLIAISLWFDTTRRIEESAASSKEESNSLLRTIFFFVTTLSGIAVVLSLSGIIFYDLLRWVFGESLPMSTFISDHSSMLAAIIPFAVIWAFYGRGLKRHIACRAQPQQRAALQRLFDSILAMAGNILVFIGAWLLLNVLSESLLQSANVISVLRGNMSSGITLLLIGLPLWVTSWRRLQSDVIQNDAQQSIIRKSFLYLLVFASVVGLMAAFGWLAYRLINAALGNQTANLPLFILKQIFLIALITLWLVYHLRILRADSKSVRQTLTERHAGFPVVLLSDGSDDTLTSIAYTALQKNLPNIPVTIYNLNSTQQPPDWMSFAALIIPAAFLLRHAPKLTEILQRFRGKVIILPENESQSIWAGLTITNPENIVSELVRLVRQNAEGQEGKPYSPINGWVITGYVLGVIFALQVLVVLFSLVVNVVMN